MTRPNASSLAVSYSFDAQFVGVRIGPAVPVHSLVKMVGGNVVVVAKGTHDLVWSTTGLAEFGPVFIESARFDGRAVGSRDIFGVPVYVEGDRQHIAVDSIVPNPLARVALHTRFVWAAALVWPCVPTLGFVGRRAWGAKPIATFSAAAVPVGVVAAIPISVKAMKSWGVAL